MDAVEVAAKASGVFMVVTVELHHDGTVTARVRDYRRDGSRWFHAVWVRRSQTVGREALLEAVRESVDAVGRLL